MQLQSLYSALQMTHACAHLKDVTHVSCSSMVILFADVLVLRGVIVG